MLSFFVNYGIITSSVSGTSLQWRVPFALQIIPGVFLLTGLATQLESPRWPVEKGKIDAAHVALTRVRRKPANDPSISRELEEIIADFEGHENLSLFLQLKASCANQKIFYRASMGVILMFWQ
jgi:SP family sugar:H+ symporter-like MFS transporter